MRATLATLLVLALSSACVVDRNAGITPPDVTIGGDTTVSFARSLDRSATLSIQNGNGAIDVTESADNLVHVTAIERLNGSPPVYIRIEETASGLTVCSLYEAGTRCEDGTSSNGSRAVVTFIVSVPRNQRIALVTGNGAVTAVTAGGAVTAITGNGDIGVSVRGATAGQDMSLTSGNGSIRVTLPGDYNTRIDATTGNGTVHSELAITLDGTFDGHRLTGRIGTGGGIIRMTTGNGTVELKALTP